MGGKKKDAPKKGKGDDEGDNPAEMNAALEAAVNGLQFRLTLE